MCGICGIFDLKEKAVSLPVLKEMTNLLRHRGPDEEGYYCRGNVGLGSRRLAIIDLKSGYQPIHNEDKSLWVVFNGEIYNFPGLKASLEKKGHKFYTKSDTECLVHLYEEDGLDFVKKLDGMFALAIWDEKEKKFVLARDPLGKKPLYWTRFEDKIIFASEIKAILSYPGFRKIADQTAIDKYFFYGFVPAPATVFQGIKKILPGHRLEFNQKGEVIDRQYWEIDYRQKLTGLSFNEIEEEVTKLLFQAVEKRLISDVPVGLFLSGGIDSGLVGAIMSRFVISKRIAAFSIGFGREKEDETILAGKTSDYSGFKHNIKHFSVKDAADLLPQLIQIMDEPMGDPSILPTLFLSLFAGQSLKVVLSGDGGDESFAGYPKYLAHQFLGNPFWGPVLKNIPAWLFKGNKRLFFQYAKLPLYLRNQLWISSFTKKAGLKDLENLHRQFPGKETLDEAFFLDQKLTLADLYLPKLDRASMSASLEVRCPLLDKNLVAFMAKVPGRIKLANRITKSLLRKIAAKYLPAEVISQPKKGFGIPLKKWLTELQPILKEYLSERDLVENKDSMDVWRLLTYRIWQKNWLN